MQRIFGINSVLGRLDRPAGVERLLLRRGKLSPRLLEIRTLAEAGKVPISLLDDAQFAELTDVNHQGVGLEVTGIDRLDEDGMFRLLAQADHDVLILILDGVTDPRNLGACIRSAATLGVDAIIVPKDHSAPLNEAAIKTASGGAAQVPVIQVTNLARSMKQLQQAGIWIVGTLLETDKNLPDVDLKGNIALVMGSEDRGIRDKTAKNCDFLVKIPMINPTFGFNVSVATGICLYEASRQRTGTKP